MRIARIKTKIERPDKDNIDVSLLNPLIKKYKHKKGNLIPLLQGAQNLYGYLPDKVFDKIAKETGLKKNEMYGVATFYAQFRLKPVGISFLGVKDGETTEDRVFTLETVACLGCCSLAPVMMIGEDTYGKLSGKKAVDVVKALKRKESLNDKSKLTDNISNN